MLVEDSLFATLDPTTRRTTTTDGRVYTMSDTVGFVRHLPHQLVEAFRSTLEEVADSDLVLHVVDGSHPDPEGQIAAVREVFAEIGADKVPEVIVINKADAADPMVIARLRQREPHSVVVSAKTGEGIDDALRCVEAELPRPGVEFEALVPYERGDLHQPDPPAAARSTSMEHTGEGTLVRGRATRGAGRRAGVVRRGAGPRLTAAPPLGAVDKAAVAGEGGGNVTSREDAMTARPRTIALLAAAALTAAGTLAAVPSQGAPDPAPGPPERGPGPSEPPASASAARSSTVDPDATKVGPAGPQAGRQRRRRGHRHRGCARA